MTTRRTKAELERELAELRETVRQKDATIAMLAKAVASPPPVWLHPAAPAVAPPQPPLIIPMQPFAPGPYDPPFYPWEITCHQGGTVVGLAVDVQPGGGPGAVGCAGAIPQQLVEWTHADVVFGGPQRPSSDLVFGAVHHHTGSH